MQTLKAGTRVRIEGFTGPRFESDWSETGRVTRPHKSWAGKLPDGYHAVRFDLDGGSLLVHRSRLMICNDQRA